MPAERDGLALVGAVAKLLNAGMGGDATVAAVAETVRRAVGRASAHPVDADSGRRQLSPGLRAALARPAGAGPRARGRTRSPTRSPTGCPWSTRDFESGCSTCTPRPPSRPPRRSR